MVYHLYNNVQLHQDLALPTVSKLPTMVAHGKCVVSFTNEQLLTQPPRYHSHYSAQYADGAFGPIVVYGPVQKSVKFDYDLGHIMLVSSSRVLQRDETDWVSRAIGITEITLIFLKML